MEKHTRTKKIFIILLTTVLSMFLINYRFDSSGVVFADSATSEIVINKDSSTDESANQDELEEENIEDPKDIESENPLEYTDDKLEDESEEITVEDFKETDKNEEELVEETPEIMAGSGEYTAGSYSELRALIGSLEPGSTAYIRLTGDADGYGDKVGIDVPANTNITIDGAKPNGTDRYLFKDNFTSDSRSAIEFLGDAEFTMKNLIIETYNDTGMIHAPSNVVNVVLDNVSGEGAFFVNNPLGNLLINDSTLVIKNENAQSRSMPVMVSRTAEFKGANELSDIYALDHLITVFDKLTFHSGSVTDLITDTNIINNSTVELIIQEGATVNFGYETMDHLFSSGKYIQVKSFENYGETNIYAYSVYSAVLEASSHVYNTGEINLYIINSYGYNVYAPKIENVNSGEINFKVEQISGNSLLLAGNELVFNNGGISITGKMNNSSLNNRSLIDVENTDGPMNFINSRIRLNFTGSNYSSVFNTSEFHFNSDGSTASYFVIENSPVLFNENTFGKIVSQQANTFSQKPSYNTFPADDLGATVRLAFKDEQDIKVNFMYTRYNTSLLDGTTLETDYDNGANFTFHNMAVVAIGNLYVDNPQLDLDNPNLTINTHPKAWIHLDSVPAAVEITPSQNPTGIINKDVEPINNGEFKLRVFGDYLYKETTHNVKKFGPLEFKQKPGNYEYGTQKIPSQDTYFDSLNVNDIIISDTREFRNGWVLSVYVETPLHIENKANSEVYNTFAFKNDPTNFIKSKPLIVKETSGSDYETEISVDADIQLFLAANAGLYINEPYSAKLVWVLEAK